MNDATQAQLRRAEAEKRVLKRQQAEGTIYEPPIYGPGSPNSWFRDIAVCTLPQSEHAGTKRQAEAEKRLHDYAAYEHHRTERTLLAARRRAEYLTETAITSTRQEAALYERWRHAGGQLFEQLHELSGIEQRALSRTDGSGGYFTVPGWFSEQFVHAPRAGAPFAALWQRLPMPPGVSSINLPRFKVGQQSGAMTDGGSVPNRDFTDSALTANLITIAGRTDVSLQWLDQCPAPVDETLGADMAEDFQLQLDGQLLLGSGSSGQALGAIPSGTLAAANSIWLSNTNNASSQTWANGGSTIAGSVHQFSAMLYSKIAAYRGLPPTSFVMNPQAWAIYSASADSQNRPLNPGTGSPELHNLPVVLDQNLPNTFGGGTAPTISASYGVTSPTDGNGTWTPILAGRWQDCIYWQSEPQVRVMLDVLSGNLQARFDVRCYVATAPNRVVWGGSNQSFSGTSQAGGVNAGAAVAYGGMSQYTSNGVLQATSLGF